MECSSPNESKIFHEPFSLKIKNRCHNKIDEYSVKCAQIKLREYNT